LDDAALARSAILCLPRIRKKKERKKGEKQRKKEERERGGGKERRSELIFPSIFPSKSLDVRANRDGKRIHIANRLKSRQQNAV